MTSSPLLPHKLTQISEFSGYPSNFYPWPLAQANPTLWNVPNSVLLFPPVTNLSASCKPWLGHLIDAGFPNGTDPPAPKVTSCFSHRLSDTFWNLLHAALIFLSLLSVWLSLLLHGNDIIRYFHWLMVLSPGVFIKIKQRPFPTSYNYPCTSLFVVDSHHQEPQRNHFIFLTTAVCKNCNTFL